MSIGPLIAAIILAAIYVVSGQQRFEGLRHLNHWISAAAGVTIAYVFIDILPALAREAVLAEERHTVALFSDKMVYVAGLLGFLTFYSLEHIPPRMQSSERAAEPRLCGLVCWLDTAGFALYSGLVAYFLDRWVERGALALIFYTIAMSLHFLVVSHSLREEQGELYNRMTCYILAGFVLLGWSLTLISSASRLIFARLVGFIAGGVVINSITKEMPKEGTVQFSAFIIGALVYAALLLLAG